MNICPFCKAPIWGEGWDSTTGDRFYSHVEDKYNDDNLCAWELSVDTEGNWKKLAHPALVVPNTESVTPAQREAKLEGQTEELLQCLWCDETFEDTPATPEDPDFCSESCQGAHENEYGTF